MLRTAALLLAVTLADPASAQTRPNQSDLKPGEYRVDVLEATDGDTFRIDGDPWILIPELARRVSVRVTGIDTPEKRGQCQQEKDNAEAATFFTRRMLLESKNQVVLSDLKWDKYGGRVQAKVRLANGDDLSQRLITMGYATPYKGEGVKTDWCAVRPR
jgi:endonuclease YncB( thermonuclease family)